jgi:hypothetical protein
MSQQIASKMISLVPTNGTEFDVNSGQKVIFELQPSLGLVKGRDSYLAIDVLNNSSDNKRLMLNHSAGVDSIIDRVDIYSLRTGQHLETLQNYNQWASITNQYLFENKTNLQQLQGVGTVVNAKQNPGGVLTPTVNTSDDLNNNILSPISTTGQAFYNFRRYTVPLKAGIFRYWDDERLCNVMGLQGLRIELTLASPSEACFGMDAIKSDGTAVDLYDATGGIACQDLAGAGFNLRTTDHTDFNSLGLAVGNQITVKSNVADLDTTINAIADVGGGELQITLANQQAISTGNKIILRGDTRALKIRPEFKVLTVAPPPALISEMMKGFNYEFTTYDHFIDNIPANARKHLIELNSVATRAVCVLTQFSNVNSLGGLRNSSYYDGEAPSESNLNSIVYFLKSRLVPVRPYNPQVNEEKVVALNEVVKSLNSINREAKDLGSFDGKDAENYTNTFLVGRQLARSPYYYDLGNAEGQIRLGFSAGRGNDMLADTYVWSRKIVSVSESGGVQVIL